MAEDSLNSGVMRFGAFELAIETGQLRKNGVRIKLSGQPIQVLTLLLANPGKLVTREQLQSALWNGNPYGDFERGLNNAINRLRENLGDSAIYPKYIETIPGRGYRFIGELALTNHGGASQLQTVEAGHRESRRPEQPSQASSELTIAQGSQSDSRSDSVSIVEDHTRRVPWTWMVAAASLLVTMVAATRYWLLRPNPSPLVESITQLTDTRTAKQGVLVTDGTRIYFNEGSYGNVRIAQVAVVGGQIGLVPTNPRLMEPRIHALSPDGSSLLAAVGTYATLIPLWNISLPLGEAERLANVEVLGWGHSTSEADFLPDGRFVFDQNDALYIAEKDGSNVRKLLAGPPGSNNHCPSVSPEGKRIVFWHTASHQSAAELAEIAPDGSNFHSITPAEVWDGSCVTWSRDGKYLLFIGFGKTDDIWVVPSESGLLRRGRKPVQITSGPLSYHSLVASPDGKHIFAIGSRERGELVRYDLNSKQYTPFLQAISAVGPSFSRDGQWVAYISYPDGTLWRSRLDGSDRLQLTYSPMWAQGLAISPDGKQVAFAGEDWNNYIVSMEGGPLRYVPIKYSMLQGWSPDGNSLLFASLVEGKPYGDKKGWELRTFDVNNGTSSALPSSQGIAGGFWIAPETIIAIEAEKFRLLKFDLTTDRWSEFLSWDKLVECVPTTDGKALYCNTEGSDPKLVRIRVADHHVEELASLKDFRILPGSLSVAPDDSPVFTRDIGTQEIYSIAVKWP